MHENSRLGKTFNNSKGVAKMTFNELDKRAIEWNQIANGHRSLEERINTQIDQCNEEMCKEFFYWLG